MSRRGALGLLALGFGVLGLFLGLSDVSRSGVDCGAVLAPVDLEFAEALNEVTGDVADVSATCDSALGDREPLVYGALGLAAVAVIASFVVPREDGPSASPSV